PPRDAGAHAARDAGIGDGRGRGPVRPRRGQARAAREGRLRRRRDADGVQHGPVLLHEKRRGPSPLADRLGQPRFDSTWFTSRTKVSSTPAPVFALAYDQGHARSRKEGSTSAPARARSFSGAALVAAADVGVR